SLSVPIVETSSAVDLDICWSDIATDLQCHPVSATADLDNVALLRISHLTKEQVQIRLAAGTLSQADVAGYLEFPTDHTNTCTKLSQFTLFGTKVDGPSMYVESTDYTYLLLFTKGTTPGQGARTMVFLDPKASSTNTKVDGQVGC